MSRENFISKMILIPFLACIIVERILRNQSASVQALTICRLALAFSVTLPIARASFKKAKAASGAKRVFFYAAPFVVWSASSCMLVLLLHLVG